MDVYQFYYKEVMGKLDDLKCLSERIIDSENNLSDELNDLESSLAALPVPGALIGTDESEWFCRVLRCKEEIVNDCAHCVEMYQEVNAIIELLNHDYAGYFYSNYNKIYMEEKESYLYLYDVCTQEVSEIRSRIEYCQRKSLYFQELLMEQIKRLEVFSIHIEEHYERISIQYVYAPPELMGAVSSTGSDTEMPRSDLDDD